MLQAPPQQVAASLKACAAKACKPAAAHMCTSAKVSPPAGGGDVGIVGQGQQQQCGRTTGGRQQLLPAEAAVRGRRRRHAVARHRQGLRRVRRVSRGAQASGARLRTRTELLVASNLLEAAQPCKAVSYQ